MSKVAVLIGSQSDFPLIIKTLKVLKDFEIDYELRILSAHRVPDETIQFAQSAKSNGFDVIIAAAGKAAHLPGVVASNTTLPVIGIPIKSSTLDGLDALFSIVQMPKGIPVATVAIDGAENAALLAVRILSLNNPNIYYKLEKFIKNMKDEVLEQDKKIYEEAKNI
ncbi:5-(carboxyamino)imidazole ribonucleotide mutase [Caldicellulosiruptoraceae bacterium PP1]